MTDPEAREMLAGYALHADDPQEARTVEVDLAQSEESRRELADMLEAAALLGEALPQVPAPESLRGLVDAAIRPEHAPRRRVLWPVVTAVAAVGVLAGVMLLLVQRLYTFLPADYTTQMRLAALLIGLVVVGVVIAIMGRLFTLVERASSTTRPAAQRPASMWVFIGAVLIVLLGAQVLLVQRQNAVLTTNDNRQAQLIGLLTSGDSREVLLRGSAPGNVRFVLNGRMREGVLVANGLPAARTGTVYQLWLLGGPKPAAAGVFAAGTLGTTVAVVYVDFHAYRGVAITVEPAPNGSPQPTSTPILSGALPPAS